MFVCVCIYIYFICMCEREGERRRERRCVCVCLCARAHVWLHVIYLDVYVCVRRSGLWWALKQNSKFKGILNWLDFESCVHVLAYVCMSDVCIEEQYRYRYWIHVAEQRGTLKQCDRGACVCVL